MLSRTLRLSLGPTMALACWLGLPSLTDADCSQPSSLGAGLAAADAVFVGSVADTSRRDSTASFVVEEVWRGELPVIVTVHGMGIAGAAEDDRQWRLGGRYLVAAQRDGEVLRDNICTATQPWTEALAAARPADVHEPVDTTPTSGPPGDPPYPLVFLLIVAGGAAATFLLLRRR